MPGPYSAPSFYFSISLTILSAILYQLLQKLTPSGANPVLAILVSYLVAIGVCLVVLALFPPGPPLGAALRQLNWVSFALAFAIVGLEVGYLLAYRSGWYIGITSLFVNTVGAILLVPVAVIAFKEKLSPTNLLGIFICIIGLILLNWKR
ncbi:MAG TPA: hypothetical protein VF498_00980 [Anaerolineales bacterium]